MEDINIKIECLNMAIRVAPNKGTFETVEGVQLHSGEKDPHKVIEIAELFYQWIN